MADVPENDIPKFMSLPVPAQITSKDAPGFFELDIEFSWSVCDPYAIHMVFKQQDEDVVWTCGSDLFIAALIDAERTWHGEGDISVRFVENACYVSLTADAERSAVVAKMSAVGLAPFVDRIARLRVLHGPHIADLISQELDKLTEDA